MKFIAKLITGLVLIIILAIAGVMYFTSDIVAAAEEFFVAVRKGEADKAYAMLAEDFRKETSKEELLKFLSEHKLNSYKEASWTNRQIEAAKGQLAGIFTAADDSAIPLQMVFVKEAGAWRIYGIEKSRAGIKVDSDSTQSTAMPTDAEQVNLVREAMHEFALSVNAKSMRGFHDYISRLWASQYTVEKLDQAYAALYESGDDLTVLKELAPVFTQKPTLDDNGVLVISGYYPSRPMQVHFEQKFIREGSSWRILGLHISYKEVGDNS